MWVVKTESSPDTQGQTAGRESCYKDLTQQTLSHSAIWHYQVLWGNGNGNKVSLGKDLDFLFPGDITQDPASEYISITKIRNDWDVGWISRPTLSKTILKIHCLILHQERANPLPRMEHLHHPFSPRLRKYQGRIRVQGRMLRDSGHARPLCLWSHCNCPSAHHPTSEHSSMDGVEGLPRSLL